ncbi:MAG: hypothetical protein ACT4OZ_01045 [Gemmatimonadota bacterium]
MGLGPGFGFFFVVFFFAGAFFFAAARIEALFLSASQNFVSTSPIRNDAPDA